jgi:hypothetical protein
VGPLDDVWVYARHVVAHGYSQRRRVYCGQPVHLSDLSDPTLFEIM